MVLFWLPVKFAHQLGGVLLLTLWASAPVAATAATVNPATAQERLCCQMMHGHCEHMESRSSQSCCDMGLPSDPAPATATVGVQNTLQMVASALFTYTPLSKVSGTRLERLDASPPQPPPRSINILRI